MARAETSVFFKAPRLGPVCRQDCESGRAMGGLPSWMPGPSGLHPILPWLFMSLPATWHKEGLPSSQKNSLTLRGRTTKSSQTPKCQTSLLCNLEAQDTAFLECLVHLSPQLTLLLEFTFLKDASEPNSPWKGLFLKKTPCTHISSLRDRPTRELPFSRMKCKSQTPEGKDEHVQC